MQPLKEAPVKAFGNDQVVKMLESWLERARTHGQIAFAAIIACENLQHVVSDYAGAFQLSFAANWGLDTVKYQLMARTHARHTEPFESPNQGSADKICYDISAGPACYDFVVWLALAEMNRRIQGAPAPLKVGFKMLDNPSERARHEAHRAKFYNNVIFPSLAFVGAVGDVEASKAPTMDKYTMRPIVELCKAGHPVPRFTPPTEAVVKVTKDLFEKDLRSPVTVTLREVKGRWEHRNSNMTAWLKFAEYLEEKGERVIFIRDTDFAGEKIAGYETYALAATDVHVRMALYESAKCNAFVSNGPWALAAFGSRPWIMFVEVDPMSVFFPETPQWWYQCNGISHGEQLPWSMRNQLIVWKRDDYENLVEGWEQLYPLLDSEVSEYGNDLFMLHNNPQGAFVFGEAK